MGVYDGVVGVKWGLWGRGGGGGDFCDWLFGIVFGIEVGVEELDFIIFLVLNVIIMWKFFFFIFKSYLWEKKFKKF